MIHQDRSAKIARSRRFLTRLLHLENEDRPAFLIGYTGPALKRGTPVRSALFSTEGKDTVRDRLQNPDKFLAAQLEEIQGQIAFGGDLVPALCPTLGVIAIPSAFGGVYIHSCGNWRHLIPSLKKVFHLRGLEFGASETPFEPVFEHFGGRVVLACRVGLHRDIKFNGMADFVSRIKKMCGTYRGVFIHVDITNGLIDETWPETDLEEIYGFFY